MKISKSFLKYLLRKQDQIKTWGTFDMILHGRSHLTTYINQLDNRLTKLRKL